MTGSGSGTCWRLAARHIATDKIAVRLSVLVLDDVKDAEMKEPGTERLVQVN